MTSQEFDLRFSGFDWKLRLLDIEGGAFGETDTDSKEIRIYIRNRSKQNIMETIIHELGHVVMFDLAQAVFRHDAEKICDQEENMIRLVSPRAFAFIRDNREFCKWLLKNL